MLPTPADQRQYERSRHAGLAHAPSNVSLSRLADHPEYTLLLSAKRNQYL